MFLCINHDFCTTSINVRCWSNSGKHLLTLSFSGFDSRSTGRRNTGIKSLCWRFQIARSHVVVRSADSHLVQIGLRMHRQVGAPWEVLSQQAIGVLVRPALPRASASRKIDVMLVTRESLMVRKFLGTVPGQRLSAGSVASCLLARSARPTGCPCCPPSLASRNVSDVRPRSRYSLFFDPDRRSPSQWPGTARSSTAAGR